MPRARRESAEPTAINGSAGIDQGGSSQPESGSAEPAKFEFPKPISPIDAALSGDASGSGADASSSDSEPERKRRKPYTRRTFVETEKTTLDLSDLKDLIYSAHQAASAIVQELELDKEEADRYAKATAQLLKHYDSKVNPKVMAWMQFSFTVGGIYGPRAVAFYKRLESEKGSRQVQPITSAPRPVGAQERPKQTVPTTPAEIWPVTPIESSN